MIDLHTHLLPGLDDGPETIEESLAVAAKMAAEGVAIAACTPHVRDDHDTTPESMEAALATLQAAVAETGIPLDVRGGGEIAIEELRHLDAAQRARYGLGGNPHLLLIEFPYYGWPLGLPMVISDLAGAGFVPVLAHPERNVEVQQRPEVLGPLIEGGAYVQLTAGSVDGSAGFEAEHCAKALLDRGLAHLIASDVHGPDIRRAGLAAARDAIKDGELARWLTEETPQALLEGRAPPPRPARMRRRRWYRSG